MTLFLLKFLRKFSMLNELTNKSVYWRGCSEVSICNNKYTFVETTAAVYYQS